MNSRLRRWPITSGEQGECGRTLCSSVAGAGSSISEEPSITVRPLCAMGSRQKWRIATKSGRFPGGPGVPIRAQDPGPMLRRTRNNSRCRCRGPTIPVPGPVRLYRGEFLSRLRAGRTVSITAGRVRGGCAIPPTTSGVNTPPPCAGHYCAPAWPARGLGRAPRGVPPRGAPHLDSAGAASAVAFSCRVYSLCMYKPTWLRRN